ncbi:MAG TPA: hypothetical protein ENK55_05650 [Actinobacteria bacterium]|nr:hypothetical protein [Actinomycetota bacterium]
MKQSWTKSLVVAGPAAVMASLFWELARMDPAYGFLIEPWAVRGYATTHGWAIFAIGLVAFVLGALVLWTRAEEERISLAIVVATVAAATAVAFVFVDRPVSLTVGLFPAVVAAIVLGHTTWKLVRVALAGRLELRLVVRIAGWLAAVAIWFLALRAAALGTTVTVPTWLAVLAGFTILGVLTGTGEPRGLAASRMLIVTDALGWLAILLQAGALRSTLLRLQAETMGIAATYRDVQVGAGWFVAGFGMVLAFVGAVAIWADRRDTMLAAIRARRQREAAEESRREIEEALRRLQATKGT